jgi:hypothetical protein
MFPVQCRRRPNDWPWTAQEGPQGLLVTVDESIEGALRSVSYFGK